MAAPAAIAPGMRNEYGPGVPDFTMTYSPTAAAAIAPAAAGTKKVGKAKNKRLRGLRIMVTVNSTSSR
jgi:hypothetical protein